MESYTLTITPSTKLWTGNIDQEGNEIVLTGLIGSLRWWMESLVRGLGGYACDPTEANCRFNSTLYQKSLKNRVSANASILKALEDGLKEVCPVCQLFGCNGYRGILNFSLENKVVGIKNEIFEPFKVKITTRRALREEEKWLCEQTLFIINTYGSVGGKTTEAPSQYGVIFVEHDIRSSFKKEEIEKWLKTCFKPENSNTQLPDLRYFWFLKDYYLNNSQIKFILGLNSKKQGTSCTPKRESDFDKFLRGQGDQGKHSSKKIFSIHSGNVRRTWGYVRSDEDLDKIKELISNSDIRFGNDILKQLG